MLDLCADGSLHFVQHIFFQELFMQESFTLRRFFVHFIWRHKYKCITVSFFNIIWGAAEAYTPYILKHIVDSMHALDHVRTKALSFLMLPLIGLVGITLLKHVLLHVADLIIEGYIAPQIMGDIRVEMLSYALHHPYSYFQKNLSGSIANKINLAAESFEKMYEAVEHWILPVSWSFLFSILILWYTNVYCALFVIAWFLSTLLISAFLSIGSIPYAQRHAYLFSRLVGNIVDVLQNSMMVKMFVGHARERRYIGDLQRDEVDAVCRLEWFLTLVRGALSVTCIGLLAGLIWFLSSGWQRGIFTAGDVVFVLTTCFNMMNTIWWLSSRVAKFYKQVGIARDALSVVVTPHQIVDASRAKKLRVSRGEIVFEHVSFHYADDPAIFNDLNVTIKAGEKVGVVGYSGSGKTTFANLIMRFFDITSGRILIDDQDISMVKQDSLREHISLIPQEPMLFSRELQKNIAYGRPNARLKEVYDAARQAHAHHFITRLKSGYRSIVGERGTTLSGGQRQRVAIARAILENAPILILDEATSALDSITEQKIQESFMSLMKNRTAIVIAHRLSTLQHMDRVLVFDYGRIIEEGTHKQLLRKNGFYAHLWRMQTGGLLPDQQPDVVEEE